MAAHHVPGCIFCRIGAGGQRVDAIYEDEIVIAFPDIHPIRPGHTQVICREHVPYFEELPGDVASRIVKVGQRIARVMKHALGVPRVAFLFTGGDIAHAHAHLVPMHQDTDITSRQYIEERELTFRSMPRAVDEDLAAMAAQLRTGLDADRNRQRDA